MKNEIIINLENELKNAMLNSDIKKLNELISDELVFVSPVGIVVTKEMDLDAHKNKIQKITKLEQSEQNIKLKDNLAIVTVKAKIEGTFLDENISGEYNYLRIWEKKNNKYQIIAGSVNKIRNI